MSIFHLHRRHHLLPYFVFGPFCWLTVDYNEEGLLTRYEEAVLVTLALEGKDTFAGLLVPFGTLPQTWFSDSPSGPRYPLTISRTAFPWTKQTTS